MVEHLTVQWWWLSQDEVGQTLPPPLTLHGHMEVSYPEECTQLKSKD